jgi:hypothetical protein
MWPRLRRCTVSLAGAQVLGSQDRETESERVSSTLWSPIHNGSRPLLDRDDSLRLGLGSAPGHAGPLLSRQNVERDSALASLRLPFPSPGVQTETTAGTRAGLAACQGLKSPHSILRPRSARQRRSWKSGHWMSNPMPREEPFWTHRACRPEVWRPKSPEQDCESIRRAHTGGSG